MNSYLTEAQYESWLDRYNRWHLDNEIRAARQSVANNPNSKGAAAWLRTALNDKEQYT